MFGKSVLKGYASYINFLARILDPALVVCASFAAYSIRFPEQLFLLPDSYRMIVVLSVLCVMAIFPLFNMYSSWRGQSMVRQAQSIFFAWIGVVLLIIVILFGLKISSDYSRLWLGYWAGLGLLFILLGRLFVYALLQYQRRRGKNLRNVIIIGAGHLGKRVVEHITNSPWTGYKIRALFDDNDMLQGTSINGCFVKGKVLDVGVYLAENEMDEIWIALPLRAEGRMKELLYDIRHYTVNVKLIPDIFGFFLINHSVTELAGLPAVNISASPMDEGNGLIKKVEDIVIASFTLVLFFPLMLILAIGVKLSSVGPVFYRQERVSWNGRPFMMYKFRSMSVHSEANGVEWGSADKMETTRFGRFIRKTSLDELPQFINVLKGDMSIVGPRPERTEFVNKFKYEIPGYMQKHMVKAGITGWAQVNGWRGDTCLKTRLEYDLYYIENWSLWFDLKIIILTIFKGFVHKNAY